MFFSYKPKMYILPEILNIGCKLLVQVKFEFVYYFPSACSWRAWLCIQVQGGFEKV